MKKKLTMLLLLAGLTMSMLTACGNRNTGGTRDTQGASSDGNGQSENHTQDGAGQQDSQNTKNPQDSQDTQGSGGPQVSQGEQNPPANKGSVGPSDDAALSELTELLGEISSTVEAGTAGASLKAVPVTLKLMDWASKYELSDAAVQDCALQYMEGLDESARGEFRVQFELVYADSQELTGKSGRSLLDDAGCEAPNFPYDASGLTELAALHLAI